MFRNGGEIQAGVSIANGLEVQSAVAVTNHVGLMANYFYINREPQDANDLNDTRRHRLFEGGAGYFANFDSYFFEIFAGYGEGEGSSHSDYFFTSNPDIASGRYNKIFIQPAIGFNKKSMHVSFVQRVSIVDFTEFSDGSTRIKINENPQSFYEPAVIGRFNFADNHAYMTWQMGISVPLFKDPYFDYRSFIISAGLGFRINAGKNQKSESEKQFRDTR
jgi:hypothetical protein